MSCGAKILDDSIEEAAKVQRYIPSYFELVLLEKSSHDYNK